MFACGRAYDQIRISLCYPNLNVKVCATHAGVTVGEDGATHQMLEDLSLMRTLPNMQVISPSDDIQTKWVIQEIAKEKGPTYVRLARLETPVIYEKEQTFEIGKGVQHGEGTDATIFATGVTVAEALKAKEELEKEGFIETVTGKGTFVSKQNTERLKEITLYDIENKLEEIIKQAKAVGVTLEEGIEIFKSIYEEV